MCRSPTLNTRKKQRKITNFHCENRRLITILLPPWPYPAYVCLRVGLSPRIDLALGCGSELGTGGEAKRHGVTTHRSLISDNCRQEHIHTCRGKENGFIWNREGCEIGCPIKRGFGFWILLSNCCTSEVFWGSKMKLSEKFKNEVKASLRNSENDNEEGYGQKAHISVFDKERVTREGHGSWPKSFSSIPSNQTQLMGPQYGVFDEYCHWCIKISGICTNISSQICSDE